MESQAQAQVQSTDKALLSEYLKIRRSSVVPAPIAFIDRAMKILGFMSCVAILLEAYFRIDIKTPIVVLLLSWATRQLLGRHGLAHRWFVNPGARALEDVWKRTFRRSNKSYMERPFHRRVAAVLFGMLPSNNNGCYWEFSGGMLNVGGVAYDQDRKKMHASCREFLISGNELFEATYAIHQSIMRWYNEMSRQLGALHIDVVGVETALERRFGRQVSDTQLARIVNTLTRHRVGHTALMRVLDTAPDADTATQNAVNDYIERVITVVSALLNDSVVVEA